MEAKLTKYELQELQDWVLSLGFDPRTMCNEFSNPTKVAELLKRFYPEVLDATDYIATTKQTKIAKWELLNVEVLHKLAFCQPKSTLVNLAYGVVTYMHRFLYDIMHAVESRRYNMHKLSAGIGRHKAVIEKSNPAEGAQNASTSKMVLLTEYQNAVRKLELKNMELLKNEKEIDHLKAQLRKGQNLLAQVNAKLAKHMGEQKKKQLLKAKTTAW